MKKTNKKRNRKSQNGKKVSWWSALVLTLCTCIIALFALRYLSGSSMNTNTAGNVPSSHQKTQATASLKPSPSLEPVVTAMPIPTSEPTPKVTEKPTPTPTPVEIELPYLLEVDKGNQRVNVFTVGKSGEYDLLVKTMICSTGEDPGTLKEGYYAMSDRYRWRLMFDRSYAQYACRIVDRILFHSVTYSARSADALNADNYENLGTPASHGCVRLTVKDAKWLYENCPKGTPIHVVERSERQPNKKEIDLPKLVSGQWDPTDPHRSNPDYDESLKVTKPDPTPYPGVTPKPTQFVWSDNK